MSPVRAHAVFPGGPECPCPGDGSIYHTWYRKGFGAGIAHYTKGLTAPELRSDNEGKPGRSRRKKEKP